MSVGTPCFSRIIDGEPNRRTRPAGGVPPVPSLGIVEWRRIQDIDALPAPHAHQVQEKARMGQLELLIDCILGCDHRRTL